MTNQIQKENKLTLVSGYELIYDTQKFLDEFYRGCFVSHAVDYITRSLFISVDGYANFLKIIFKAVFASHIINIDVKSNSKSLIYNIELDTAKLSDQNISDMLGIADESGFHVEINSTSISVKFDFTTTVFTAFQAVSTSVVYNYLKIAFLS